MEKDKAWWLKEWWVPKGPPVTGLPSSELIAALAAVTDSPQLEDKRFLSLTVLSTESIVVKTGELLEVLHGKGQLFHVQKSSGQWIINDIAEWGS